MSAVIEKYSTILPRNGQGKRIVKAKLLTALGATGVLLPFPANTERTIERKILLQNTFSPNPAPPTTHGLLFQLGAYFKMDDAGGGPRLDATGNGHTLTDNNANLVGTAPGIINTCVTCSQTVASNCLKSTDAIFGCSVGNSFSISCWCQSNAIINDHGIISLDNSAAVLGYDFYYASVGTLFTWGAFETGTHTFKTIGIVTNAAFNNGAFHHFAMGYDDGNQVLWTQYDGGARSTVGINGINTAVPTVAGPFVVGNFSTLASPQQINVDEMGFWNRVLSTADVATLFNGGAALPFGSFTL